MSELDGKALANIEATQRGTRDEMVLQSALGFSMMFTRGMTSEAYAAVTRAAELAGSLHDPDYHLLALNSLCAFRLRLADFGGRSRWPTSVRPLPNNSTMRLLGRPLTGRLGVSLYFLGEYTRARAHLERVLAQTGIGSTAGRDGPFWLRPASERSDRPGDHTLVTGLSG
jgi:hypothetical protein